MTTHREAVRATWRRVPAEKLSTMVARTIWGLAFIALGLAMGMGWIFASAPVLVSFSTVIFGAIMVSGQLTTHPARLFVALVRDLLDAIRHRESR